jgi:hypothetical protein
LLLATFINMWRIDGPTAETLSKGAENREAYQTKFEISLTPTPFADETTCIFTYFEANAPYTHLANFFVRLSL